MNNPLRKLKQPSVLPGFGPTLGCTVFYLSCLVILPLGMLFFKTAQLTWADFLRIITEPRALAAYRLSFFASMTAATINAIFGLVVAWVLVRYRFPGKKLVDMLIDLPFALPTAVAGIALTTLYAEQGWIGSILNYLGIKASFTPLGITIALTFIGLPFVVRTLEPVIQDLDPDVEEAAACLGANRLQTFVEIIFPHLIPALLTGFAMAFGRAVGEYGSVVFIAGNMPLKTEIAPLVIITKLEQYDYQGAAAIAVVMLVLSFFFLFAINTLQWWSHHRHQES